MCVQRVIHAAAEKEAVCVRTRKGWGRWGVGRGVPACTKIIQFTGSAELHTDLLPGGGHIDVYLLAGQADVYECGMPYTSVCSGSVLCYLTHGKVVMVTEHDVKIYCCFK